MFEGIELEGHVGLEVANGLRLTDKTWTREQVNAMDLHATLLSVAQHVATAGNGPVLKPPRCAHSNQSWHPSFPVCLSFNVTTTIALTRLSRLLALSGSTKPLRSTVDHSTRLPPRQPPKWPPRLLLAR